MKKKQKAEPESRRKSSYQGNSRNNSKSGGLTFSEKKRLIQLKHILSGKSNEKEKPTTAQTELANENLRKAMTFALDRDAITGDVLKDGSAPCYTAVPPQFATGPDGSDFSADQTKFVVSSLHP